VIEVAVPGAVGLLLFGDTVYPGWAVPALLAVLLAVGGCVMLARSPANGAAA